MHAIVGVGVGADLHTGGAVGADDVPVSETGLAVDGPPQAVVDGSPFSGGDRAHRAVNGALPTDGAEIHNRWIVARPVGHQRLPQFHTLAGFHQKIGFQTGIIRPEQGNGGNHRGVGGDLLGYAFDGQVQTPAQPDQLVGLPGLGPGMVVSVPPHRSV